MDPNLYFRFAFPGWTATVVAAVIVLLGDMQAAKALAQMPGDQIGAVLAAALLGPPALGFLLNTLVVAACELTMKGPAHSRYFGEFRKRVEDVLRSDPSPRCSQIADRVREALPASIVAQFEYRTDPEVLLQWRRRQRAAFFGNWANILAIILATILTYKYWSFLAILIVLLLIASFVFLAWRSPKTVDGQQKIWMESLTDDDVLEFMLNDGKGSAWARDAKKASASRPNGATAPSGLRSKSSDRSRS